MLNGLKLIHFSLRATINLRPVGILAIPDKR
jgi:hypothetical protein